MIQTKFQNSEQKPILQSQLLQRVSGIDHYCSMRGFENAGAGVWLPRQTHGTDIVIVDDHTAFDPNTELQAVEADAVVTQQKGRWIGVRTADCVPVLLYDPVTSTVAAVHAGWRGTMMHIVSHTIALMRSSFNVKPDNLYAVIGPSIGPDAFEVGEEVAAAFVETGRKDCVLRQALGAAGRFATYTKPHVDLWKSNAVDMMEAGVLLEHLDCTPLCTFENESVLFSARKQGVQTGRIVSAICLV